MIKPTITVMGIITQLPNSPAQGDQYIVNISKEDAPKVVTFYAEYDGTKWNLTLNTDGDTALVADQTSDPKSLTLQRYAIIGGWQVVNTITAT